MTTTMAADHIVNYVCGTESTFALIDYFTHPPGQMPYLLLVLLPLSPLLHIVRNKKKATIGCKRLYSREQQQHKASTEKGGRGRF